MKRGRDHLMNASVRIKQTDRIPTLLSLSSVDVFIPKCCYGCADFSFKAGSYSHSIFPHQRRRQGSASILVDHPVGDDAGEHGRKRACLETLFPCVIRSDVSNANAAVAKERRRPSRVPISVMLLSNIVLV